MNYIKRISKNRICVNCNKTIKAGEPAWRDDWFRAVTYTHCEGECWERAKRIFELSEQADKQEEAQP
jgi:hypothetical protein